MANEKIYRPSRQIRFDINNTEISIKRTESSLVIDNNRIKNNTNEILSLDDKIKDATELFEKTKEEKYKKLIESFKDTQKKLEESIRLLNIRIQTNTTFLDEQRENLLNLEKELVDTLEYESNVKERSLATFVNTQSGLNYGLLVPSSITIPSGTPIHLIFDGKNSFMKYGYYKGNIEDSISKELDYSKISLNSDRLALKIDSENGYTTYSVQVFDYDLTISTSRTGFILIDEEFLRTDNSIWIMVNGLTGEDNVAVPR